MNQTQEEVVLIGIFGLFWFGKLSLFVSSGMNQLMPL
jgi:hypothetical protein